MFQIKFVPSRAYAWFEEHKITTVSEMRKYFKKKKVTALFTFVFCNKEAIVGMKIIAVHVAAITYLKSFHTSQHGWEVREFILIREMGPENVVGVELPCCAN